MFKKIATLICAMFLVACGGEDDIEEVVQEQPPFSTTASFSVELNGMQHVPMTDSEQTATATIEIDESTLQVRAYVDVSEVSGFVGAHLHQAAIGKNGSLVYAFADANGGTYEITPKEVTQAQIDSMKAGEWYVDIHTEDFISGEIRGQIVDEDTSILTFKLDGQQEVPMVDTEAVGYGYATYNSNSTELVVRIVPEGLDDVEAAHIHTGRFGTNGDVFVGLELDTADMTTWETPADTMIDAETLATLLSGGHYVNVHTETVASGEIRGQILTENFAMATFKLAGHQEVPMVNTTAIGDGYALVNTDNYNLELQVVTTGVEDATAAHIHTGEIGTNGPVLVGLEQSMTDENVWSTPANTAINAEVFEILANGGHYVNVHTPSQPSGELRGQILTDNFVFTSFTLSGDQEVPSVMTDASGEAWALIDLDDFSVDIKVLTSGVPDATAAHIHTGRIGFNGGVLAGLEQSESNENMWMTSSDLMIDAETFAVLASGGHYINIHTPANESGELRGQILTQGNVLVTFGLDGEQEVPSVMTEAMGYGYAIVNTSNFAVELAVVTSGVDDATAAHIHTGRIGENGPVLAALEQNADDVSVWQSPSDLMIDAETFAVLASGGHYVNVHTPTVESGEIRGQILTDNFVLVTFGLDGDQEVPAVMTEAMGDGYALVNTDDYSLEVTVITTGVDDATAAHIHTGDRGTNGPVLAGLIQSEMDAGIWKGADDLMIDADIFTVLAGGGHYVNVHTPAHPSGEIRGQIE